jgi:hypothetical protein
MECWNTEDPRRADEMYFYMDGPDQKLKSGYHPLFAPNIPFFSPVRRLYEPEAIIPIFPLFPTETTTLLG